jgi:hypothetical protein
MHTAFLMVQRELVIFREFNEEQSTQFNSRRERQRLDVYGCH